jgi:hypothetical protein
LLSEHYEAYSASHDRDGRKLVSYPLHLIPTDQQTRRAMWRLLQDLRDAARADGRAKALQAAGHTQPVVANP